MQRISYQSLQLVDTRDEFEYSDTTKIMASRPGFLGHFIAHGIIILLLLIVGWLYTLII